MLATAGGSSLSQKQRQSVDQRPDYHQAVDRHRSEFQQSYQGLATPKSVVRRVTKIPAASMNIQNNRRPFAPVINSRASPSSSILEHTIAPRQRLYKI